MKLFTFIISLLSISLVTSFKECCYSPKHIEQYGKHHVLCDNIHSEYDGFMFIHVLPGKFYLCNNTCPQFVCVTNTSIAILNDIGLTMYVAFQDCFTDLDKKYFCK